MPNRRSVITGIGLVNALGLGSKACFDAMLAGKTGIEAVKRFDAEKLPCRVAGEAPEEKLNNIVPKNHRKSVKLMSRDIQLAVLAADDAMKDCGLNTRANNPDGPIDINPTRSGVNIGAGSMCCDLQELSQAAKDSVTDGKFDLNKWGAGGMESLTPLWLLKYLPNMLSCHVSIIYDLQGPSNSITCGDASGIMSIGEAYRNIRRDKADIVLAGGAESKINPMNFMRFALNNVISTKYNDAPQASCRPFDADADGIIPAEGGGILVLEEYQTAAKRGARIYAEVTGFGCSFNHGKTDGDMIVPAADAKGTIDAINAALHSAGITANQLGLIVAHGNGIPEYDKFEAAAIKEITSGCSEMPYVLATKSRFGVAGAGSGAMDAAIAAICVSNNIIPATLNCNKQIEGAELNLTTSGNVEKQIDHALIISMSLGGQTAALIVSKVK